MHKNCIRRNWSCLFLTSESAIQTTLKITCNTIFFLSRLDQTNVETMSIFHSSKLRRAKYVETTSIFCPSKLRWRKYVKTTSSFCPWTLRRGKYVKTTPIFCPMKLHWKITSKWCGHLSIFSLWHIEINRYQIDVDSKWCVRWYM